MRFDDQRLHFLLIRLKIPKGNPKASSTVALKSVVTIGLYLES